MENVTFWELEREIKDMAASCVGLSVKTARKKASNLFEKYRGLIHTSSSGKLSDEKLIDISLEKIKCLRTGCVRYTSNGVNKGLIRLKDICHVEIRDKYVFVTIKTGKEVRLDLYFDFLIDII